jgi:cation diffusion facilitator family transporter
MNGPNRTLERYALLSVAAAIVTIALKLLAWWLTGSVGLLSDALESVVNLAGALLALWMLRLSAMPPDEAHPYGRSKAEYFSSGVEGGLIVVAALSIVWVAFPRLIAPQAISVPYLGIAVSVVASAVNLATALILLRAGREYHSIALEADAHHLLTDVWTSVGVIVGIGLVAVTGWMRLDPIIALAVAGNILWTGTRLMRRSVTGLLDPAIPEAERADIANIFKEYSRRYGVSFHALRTRHAGARRFISFHLLVPDGWTVAHAHQLAEEIESRIRSLVPHASTFSHIEPISHPSSYDDIPLDR